MAVITDDVKAGISEGILRAFFSAAKKLLHMEYEPENEEEEEEEEIERFRFTERASYSRNAIAEVMRTSLLFLEHVSRRCRSPSTGRPMGICSRRETEQ